MSIGISGPLYEGDGLIHRWATSKRLAGTLAKAGKAAQAEATADFGPLDLAAIERQAHRMRAVTVAWLVDKAFESIARWARRPRDDEAEAYLARSTDLAELERRMRRVEARFWNVG